MGSILEFSKNTKISGQELLFDKSKILKKKNNPIPEKFYESDYIVINDIPDINSAEHFLEEFISGIDESKIPLYSKFINKIQLAKIDLIPVCHDIIPRTFQALHFDMGQPIVSPSSQTMYVILALYKPKESEPSSANTRVVSLNRLSKLNRLNLSSNLAENRLVNYAKNYGDGWKEPTFVNTFRLGCFARVVDAISGKNELVNDIDKTTGQWFGSIENERAFFDTCGLSIEQAEVQINVKPGQLLIIDNMRCVHGRIGPRKPQEIYQFLFGVKSATPDMIDDFRKWVLEHLA